jgi:hypothetical protein
MTTPVQLLKYCPNRLDFNTSYMYNIFSQYAGNKWAPPKTRRGIEEEGMRAANLLLTRHRPGDVGWVEYGKVGGLPI